MSSSFNINIFNSKSFKIAQQGMSFSALTDLVGESLDSLNVNINRNSTTLGQLIALDVNLSPKSILKSSSQIEISLS
jgi:hypothetical protein